MLVTMDSDDDTKEVEELQEWIEQNLKGMKNKFTQLQDEMRNNKPSTKINVRRVSADDLSGQDEDQIVVEHKVQRWYSINYFKKMLQESKETQKGGGESGDIF